MKKLSKSKIKKAREAIKKLKKTNQDLKAIDPVFDDIFVDGIKALNSIS